MKLGLQNVPIFSLVWEGHTGLGGIPARVFINNCAQAHSFSLLPHRQEEHFRFTLLNTQNYFKRVAYLLTINLKWPIPIPLSKCLPDLSFLHYFILIKWNNEKRKEKWSVKHVVYVPSYFKTSQSSLVSSDVWNILYPTKKRMKNWSPPNFKYCIFPQLQTAGRAGRLKSYQTKQQAVLTGPTAHPRQLYRQSVYTEPLGE